MPGEKTEKATPKRKKDERKKGNVFLSQEVVTIVTLLATFYTLRIIMPFVLDTLEAGIKHFADAAASEDTLTYASLQKHYLESAIIFAKTALIPLLICGFAATAATMAQTKLLFSAQGFAFKGNRISPMQGIKRMFSARSAVELLKSILKISVLLYVIYTVLKKDIAELPRMMDMTLTGSFSEIGSMIMAIVIKAGAIFIALAGADYLYQWWEYEKNLRMTKQEIKDEFKQTEGDPQIKSRIRAIQQQRARRRMMQKVPKADVVIRNPTHFAVAVMYDQNVNRAPVVVAKGADALALRIVKVAEENGVYITENKPLARALYETVELDREIPEQFYRAIAEVLAFVYNLKKQKRQPRIPELKGGSKMSSNGRNAVNEIRVDDPEELMRSYKANGDVELRNRLVMHYIQYVNAAIYSMRSVLLSNIPFEDFFNQGVLALIDCIERYDPERGASFDTYSYLGIRGSILKYLRKQNWLPNRVWEARKKIAQGRSELEQKLMREPTDRELAEHLSMSEKQLDGLITEMSVIDTVSFEELLESAYTNMTENIGHAGEGDVSDRLLQEELLAALAAAIDELPAKQKQVISLYYYENLNLREIGDVLSVSQQRVSQIRAKALESLTERMRQFVNGERKHA